MARWLATLDERLAGRWSDGAVSAVGEVTLLNRAEIVARVGDAAEDGELLTRLLAREGIAGIKRARGAFALCADDGDGLLLIRDPVGERTLFRTRDAASSSLRALRDRMPRPELDRDAVAAFLTFAYVPGEATLIEGIREVLPGRAVRLRAGGEETEHYWEPSEDGPQRSFAAELERAVEERLPGGPVAVLLSGGIDSSAVTALAARHREVHTFSISFGDELPSERGYAELVAAHCGTAHRTITVSGEEVAARLEEAMALLDCPVGDPLTVPNLLLDEAVAAAGHRVLLNGEGGDPVLGGPKNLPMLVHELQHAPDAEERADAYLRSYRKLGALVPEHRRAPLRDHVSPYLENGMSSLLHRLLHTNLRTKGAHHILPKVDRLTASAGLEGRSPLFDQRLIETAFAAPPEAKLAGTREKAVLKDAVRDLLPETITERPKSGMRVPVQAWLDGPLKRLGRELLLGERTRARGLVDPALVRGWLAQRGSLWPRHGQQLWLVLSLELWLRSYLDP